ncbi:hypothetical protein SAMN05421770_10448 [Granulicella rosea]|uniref:DUF5666 domain-containing protein n=1 Tax=Granulicella rosea TaxID=474952 RepID=A0A239JN16_9BACT|nr:hypothetical protein [Granulicella rosea]SNT07406.1 hypothetical protein SAMN05421770_10448 [Granulicella rosea]
MLTDTLGRYLRAATLGILVLATAHACLGQGGPAQDGPPQGGPPAGGGKQGGIPGGQMIRGTVTAVAPEHLTVKTQEGEVYQVVTTPNTQIRKGREQVKLADVKAEDGLGAMGVLDAPNKTLHAAFLQVVDAEQLKKAREAMGKTYIAGKVTKIDTDALKLTILREDGVTQVIGLDDDTSFRRGGRGGMGMMGMGPGMGGGNGGGGGNNPDRPRRNPPADGQQRQQGGGGESITLADLKVGDVVAGPGAIKGGVFIPTEVRVADSAAAGIQRRRRNQDGAAPAGTTPADSAAEPKA